MVLCHSIRATVRGIGAEAEYAMAAIVVIT